MISNAKTIQVPADEDPFSLLLRSRLLLPYTNTTENGWLNELWLEYDLSKTWSLNLYTGYMQMFDSTQSTYTDWVDSEIYATYKFEYKKHNTKTILELSAGALLPTANKFDQMATEEGGVLLRDHLVVDLSYIRFEQWESAYRVFYRNDSYVSPTGSAQPSPENPAGPDNFALLDVTTPVTSPKVLSNSIYYFDTKLIAILPVIVKPLKLRNEVRLQSWQNFDGSADNILHDIPGVGYVWSKTLTTYLSFDCSKDLDQAGSLFDKNNITTMFSVYLYL